MMDSRMKKLAGIRTIEVFKFSDTYSIRSLELSLYRGLIGGTGSGEWALENGRHQSSRSLQKSAPIARWDLYRVLV